MKNKTLLLSIGTVSLVIIPFMTVVSCSSDNGGSSSNSNGTTNKPLSPEEQLQKEKEETKKQIQQEVEKYKNLTYTVNKEKLSKISIANITSDTIRQCITSNNVPNSNDLMTVAFLPEDENFDNGTFKIRVRFDSKKFGSAWGGSFLLNNGEVFQAKSM